MCGGSGSWREGSCTWQSRNSRNVALGNIVRTLPMNQMAGKKVFGGYVPNSKLESRRLKGSENQWAVSPKERHACVANPLPRSVSPRGGCRHV